MGVLNLVCADVLKEFAAKKCVKLGKLLKDRGNLNLEPNKNNSNSHSSSSVKVKIFIYLILLEFCFHF